MDKKNTAQEREFFGAICQGQTDEVRRLVATAPELLQSFDYTSFGATPITRVCFNDDRAMIETLIDLGADLDRRSDWDMGPWSPLHCAVFQGNSDLADYLLRYGATMDAHTAAGTGRVDELQKLIAKAPSCVRELGGDGCQPLHFADSREIAQVLLDHGADKEARCIDHFSTPVQYLAGKRSDVARYLFAKGAQADIFSAVMANDETVLQRLVHEDPTVLNARINQEYFPPGPDHNVHNILTFMIGNECTVMHAAAIGNHPGMVELLTKAGLSPNVRGGYDEQTPLHSATWHDHLEVAKSLVQHGADINLRSGELHNNSPAGWAIVAGSADVFEFLMESGAEVLDSFVKDAHAAATGAFRQVKIVPQENYDRIVACLAER